MQSSKNWIGKSMLARLLILVALLRRNTSPGCDYISQELVKYWGAPFSQHLHFQRCWQPQIDPRWTRGCQCCLEELHVVSALQPIRILFRLLWQRTLSWWNKEQYPSMWVLLTFIGALDKVSQGDRFVSRPYLQSCKAFSTHVSPARYSLFCIVLIYNFLVLMLLGANLNH